MIKRNLTVKKPIVNDDKYTVAKDRLMQSYNIFISDLIREHAKHESDGYVLYVDQLPLYDQKILLSYLISAQDYADALSSPSLTAEYIADYTDCMQYAINSLIDEVYHEDMEEMGMCLHRHRDGDLTWVRR